MGVDDFMATPNFSMFATTNLVTAALAEKTEAVAMWKKMESLAQQIHFADPQTQDFVETSCAYGRIKYSIFEQAWTIRFTVGWVTNQVITIATNFPPT